MFALTLLVYGVATGAAALSWSVAALLVFRFVIGLGLGAELPVASTLVSEFVRVPWSARRSPRPSLAAAGHRGGADLGHGAVLVQPRRLGRLYAATPEVYLTAARATGAGWAAGFGRIASILAPFAVPPLRTAGGSALGFAAFAAFFLMAAVAP